MQQESIIFKEVELLVQPSHREMKNRKDQTPRELFSIEHANLLRKGEEWVRNTATQCMLVATIIATVVFAAIFSVPAGDNDEEGIPTHWRNVVFRMFAVSEAMALSFSLISILIYLSILTAPYVEKEFLSLLPLRLVFGLLTLCISIATMMLAFVSSFFLAYNHHRSNFIPIISAVSVTFPLFVFWYLQSELLRDLSYLSFRFMFSTKPGKGWKTQIKLY
ncbi:hypothetical protein Pint_21382 [Pistacia integerrima]|uniref:Uncharacterized protein n=1 Tax=Pistacia integerrima TaxID=434235 RepID=A0ACC0X7Z7_9ROSI|nr:hypothetical protein Pint_21382 [Pistacia integerrima]